MPIVRPSMLEQPVLIDPLARKRFLACVPLAAALLVSHATSAPIQNPPDQQLFSQAARARLQRDFANPDISWLLMDASGNVVAERWLSQNKHEEAAVSPGSLVKPFLALAYAEQHNNEFPKVRCLGTETHCWLPSGHGTLGLEEAIAQSCNTYFLDLAEQLNRGRAAQTFAHYGLTGPASTTAAESLIGLGSEWKESPLAVARAYLQLEKEQQRPVQGRVVRGMLDSAAHGTGRAVDAALGPDAALAKSGTAVCSHTPKGAADGFTVVLYPAAQPRLLLLVRAHGKTGAESAKIAGAMLRALQAGN